MLKNVYHELRPLAESLVAMLSSHTGVMGICFLGGLGMRRYLDRYSDLDIAVFLEHSASGSFLPPFSFSVRHAGRYVEFNLSQHAYDDEATAEWDSARVSAYSTADIVFDRDGRLSALIEERTKEGERSALAMVVTAMNQVWWRGIYHSYVAVRRGDLIAAHLLVNEAVALLIQTFCQLETAQVHHTKWHERVLRGALMDGSIGGLVEEAMRITELSRTALINRRASLRKFYKHTLALAASRLAEFPKDLYRYWATYYSRRQLGSGRWASAILSDPAAMHLTSCDKRQLFGALCFARCQPGAGPRQLLDIVLRNGILEGRLVEVLKNLIGGLECESL